MVTIHTHEEFLTACFITLETRDTERERVREGGGGELENIITEYKDLAF